jgi:hypothetical protein
MYTKIICLGKIRGSDTVINFLIKVCNFTVKSLPHHILLSVFFIGMMSQEIALTHVLVLGIAVTLKHVK